MSNFNETQINRAWNAAQVANEDSKNTWRKDPCGAWINRDQYGQESNYGWEIDHTYPSAKGGTDHADNLRAMHWRNNRSKSDDFPDYKSALTSESNKNIEKEEYKTVNDTVKNKLNQLYNL